MTARNVIAYIAGGAYRQISASSPWLTLDGSPSIEPGQNKNYTPELTYTWSISYAEPYEEVYLSKDNDGKYAFEIDRTNDSLMRLQTQR